MITCEITEFAVLSVLSKCTVKVTMHELFDKIPKTGLPEESAIAFIKTLNRLLEMEMVATSQNSDGAVHWNIREQGREYVRDFLNP